MEDIRDGFIRHIHEKIGKNEEISEDDCVNIVK